MIVSAYYGELAVTADLITQVGAAYGRGRGLVALASMRATTVFLLFRSFAVQVKYQSGASASGSVTFIASYHYVRIFNSWVDAYA